MLIGMLHNRGDPNKVSRAYLYSAISKIEDADFFYFTTKSVNFEEKQINGFYYEKGKWKEKLFPFPDVVINAANQKTRKQNEVYYKLEKLIPYTSYPVGSKIFVYNKLLRTTYLKQFLIPFKEIKKINDILVFLNKYKEIIVKPIRGHHGDNLIKIEKINEKIIVTEKTNIFECNTEELINYLEKYPKKCLAQKYIKSTLRTGEPFDYRLHLQKNKNANWQTTIIIPRIGTKNYVITNISQGSQMVEFVKFLKNEYKEKYKEVKEKIETFALKFVHEFEEQYPYNFDELGIDIGFDDNRNIWVYEVNFRPGHIFIEVATAKNAIHYAMFLGNKGRRENEKNISK